MILDGIWVYNKHVFWKLTLHLIHVRFTFRHDNIVCDFCNVNWGLFYLLQWIPISELCWKAMVATLYTIQVKILYTFLFYFLFVVRKKWKKNCFNDALDTFYSLLHGVGHMIQDHSGSKIWITLLPLQGQLFLNSSKSSFICTIPQTG